MKSSQTRPLVYSTLSRSASRNHERAGFSQCSNVPRSPLHPVNAPLTSMSMLHFAAGGYEHRAEQDRFIGPGRLAFDFAPVVERQRKLDRRIAGELLVGMRMAAVDRPDRPVAVVPAKPHVADAAVDFGMHINRENGPARLGPLVLDRESLDVLARRFFAAGVGGKAIADHRHVGDHHVDRPAPPRELGRQQVRDAQVLLIGFPGRLLREPVEPPADRQPAHDRAEMTPAVRQVAFPRPDRRMQTDRRKVKIVGRAPRVDANGHQPVAHQPLGARDQGVGALGPIREGWAERSCPDRCSGPSLRSPSRRSRDSAAARPLPAAVSARSRGCCPPLFSIQYAGSKPRNKIVGRKLDPHPLIVLNRMGADHRGRPHPGPHRPAKPAFRRRFNPGSQHRLVGLARRSHALGGMRTLSHSNQNAQAPASSARFWCIEMGAPRGGRAASHQFVDPAEHDASTGEDRFTTRRIFEWSASARLCDRPR